MLKDIRVPIVGSLLILLMVVVRADAQDSTDDGKLRIICFGAHPDDAEYKSGGTAALWAQQGHHVKLVSVTNGDIGHWQNGRWSIGKAKNRRICVGCQAIGCRIQSARHS